MTENDIINAQDVIDLDRENAIIGTVAESVIATVNAIKRGEYVVSVRIRGRTMTGRKGA